MELRRLRRRRRGQTSSSGQINLILVHAGDEHVLSFRIVVHALAFMSNAFISGDGCHPSLIADLSSAFFAMCGEAMCWCNVLHLSQQELTSQGPQ